MDERLQAIYWATSSEKSSAPFFPYIKIDYSEEGGFKVKTEEDVINIGMSFEAQVLLVLDYYAYFSKWDNKITFETSKFSGNETITAFDHEQDDLFSFDRNAWKAFKEERRLDAKYSRIAYIKPLSPNIPTGIYEMQIKLSQSHGMDKDKKYRFDVPIEDGFAKFMNWARNNYATKKVKVGINSYRLPPAIQVFYPTFQVLGDTDIESSEVLGLIDRIKAVDKYKAWKILKNNPSDNNKGIYDNM